MPEGDNVWRSARLMDNALAGDVLTTSDFRVPRLATCDLTGRQVIEVVPRGKHLLTRVDGGLTLHTHFEMEGTWRVFARGARWSGGPAHDIRLVLGTSRSTAVGYRIPVVELVETSRESEVVGHLGPDLLDEGFDAAEAVRRLAAKPDTAIGDALLDQRNLAGIGNIYKAEVLFLSGTNPWTRTGDVIDLGKLVDLAKRLLLANRDRGDRVTTGNRRPGEQLWVYGRAGRPCRRCGQRVRRAMQGARGSERAAFWCSACQAGPEFTPTAISEA